LRAQVLEPERALAEPPLEVSLRVPKPEPLLSGLQVLRHSEQLRKALPREQQLRAQRRESPTARES